MFHFHLLGRGFHPIIKNVSFPSPTDVESHIFFLIDCKDGFALASSFSHPLHSPTPFFLVGCSNFLQEHCMPSRNVSLFFLPSSHNVLKLTLDVKCDSNNGDPWTHYAIRLNSLLKANVILTTGTLGLIMLFD